jgi:hypothetical protein
MSGRKSAAVEQGWGRYRAGEAFFRLIERGRCVCKPQRWHAYASELRLARMSSLRERRAQDRRRQRNESSNGPLALGAVAFVRRGIIRRE